MGHCCYAKLCKPRNQHDIRANQSFYSFSQRFTKNVILTYQELRKSLLPSSKKLSWMKPTVMWEDHSWLYRQTCILELLFFSFFPALLHLWAHIPFSVHKLFSVQFPHLPHRQWSTWKKKSYRRKGKWWDPSVSFISLWSFIAAAEQPGNSFFPVVLDVPRVS